MKVAIKKQRFEGIKANKQANNDEVFSYINPMTNMMRKLLFGLNPPKACSEITAMRSSPIENIIQVRASNRHSDEFFNSTLRRYFLGLSVLDSMKI